MDGPREELERQTSWVSPEAGLGELSHHTPDAGHGADGKDKVESKFRRPVHLDLPDNDDWNRQQAEVHAHVDDAEDRSQFAGRNALRSGRQFSRIDGVETSGWGLALEDIQDEGKQGVNKKECEKDPMGDHPSFRSETGDAHVETCNGHFDNPDGDEKHDPIHGAELVRSVNFFFKRQSTWKAAYKFEDVKLMVRDIVYVFPRSSILNHHDHDDRPGNGENLQMITVSTPSIRVFSPSPTAPRMMSQSSQPIVKFALEYRIHKRVLVMRIIMIIDTTIPAMIPGPFVSK